MANKTTSPTKVIILCRISFANIWEAKSINGGDEKYSVSCLIPKEDKATLTKMDFYRRAVEQCIEGGYNAVTFELELPGIDGDFQIAFWKDGHVDSGSTRSICDCLASR